jgi:aspartate beta-hydroxylase
MTAGDEMGRSFGTLKAVSVRTRRRVVWELLLLSARRAGIAAADLRRVEEYLAVTFGLARPAYRHPQQRPRNYFPGLSARPWYDPVEYEWTQRLRAAYEVICEELAAVRGGPGAEPATRQHLRDIEVQGRWDVFYFYVFGRRHAANHALCPRTAALLGSIPGLCGSGLSYFSVLQAGSHITPHCAPSNLRIRCQLALIAPPGGRFRVGTEVRTWEEAQCLVLDGSFEHEVWASDQGDRTVLTLDVWHPELTEVERWALGELNRYSRDVRRYWKATLGVAAERASAAQARAA